MINFSILVGFLILSCSVGTTVILEELAEDENIKVNVEVFDLPIGLHIHSLWNNSVVENWDYYKKATENLKKSFPNLKVIHPNGGHSYHPRNGTLRQLRCDLLLVHNALDAITKQVQNQGLKIGEQAGTSINYTLFHFIDEEKFNQTEYEHVLDEVFGRNVTTESLSSAFSDKLNAITLKYQLNEISVRIEIHTLSTKSVGEGVLDYGRLDYKSDKWLSIQSRLIPNEN